MAELVARVGEWRTVSAMNDITDDPNGRSFIPEEPDYLDQGETFEVDFDLLGEVILIDEQPAKSAATVSLFGTAHADAELFARQMNDRVLWNSSRGVWMEYDGKRWATSSHRSVVAVHVARFVNDLYAQADEKVRRAVVALPRLRQVAEAASGMPAMQASEADFDVDPYMLNLQNGVLDLRTGDLMQHDPKLRMTSLSPVAWDPTAECPTWWNFIHQTFQNDMELEAYVQRALGYSITAATTEAALMLCVGTGQNGKSLMFNVLRAVLGTDMSMQAETTLFTSQRSSQDQYSLADLRSKRFIVATELEDGARLSEALVKQLTGNDTIRARRIYEQPTEFSPTSKIWLTANVAPTVSGTDRGIWRRIRYIPFLNVVTNPDADLLSKLQLELPGILRWLVDGAMAWRSAGIGSCDAVSRATEQYRQSQDVVGQFLDEMCTVATDEKVQASELWQSFSKWVQDTHGLNHFTGRKMASALAAKGFESRKHGKAQNRFYFGLRLNEPHSYF